MTPIAERDLTISPTSNLAMDLRDAVRTPTATAMLTSELILIPSNAIIHSLMGTTDVNATIPIVAGIVLVVISVLLTLIGGLIPAKKAAKKDPVIALRSE